MLVRTAENIKDPLFRFFEREVGLLGQILKVSSYMSYILMHYCA